MKKTKVKCDVENCKHNDCNCCNLEELDIYLDCLDDNELEKFSCFKIIYKSLPKLRKKAKFQEF